MTSYAAFLKLLDLNKHTKIEERHSQIDLTAEKYIVCLNLFWVDANRMQKVLESQVGETCWAEKHMPSWSTNNDVKTIMVLDRIREYLFERPLAVTIILALCKFSGRFFWLKISESVAILYIKSKPFIRNFLIKI